MHIGEFIPAVLAAASSWTRWDNPAAGKKERIDYNARNLKTISTI